MPHLILYRMLSLMLHLILYRMLYLMIHDTSDAGIRCAFSRNERNSIAPAGRTVIS
jgi:hypothetical protein